MFGPVVVTGDGLGARGVVPGVADEAVGVGEPLPGLDGGPARLAVGPVAIGDSSVGPGAPGDRDA